LACTKSNQKWLFVQIYLHKDELLREAGSKAVRHPVRGLGQNRPSRDVGMYSATKMAHFLGRNQMTQDMPKAQADNALTFNAVLENLLPAAPAHVLLLGAQANTPAAQLQALGYQVAARSLNPSQAMAQLPTPTRHAIGQVSLDLPDIAFPPASIPWRYGTNWPTGWQRTQWSFWWGKWHPARRPACRSGLTM
jgi:hypothetical protein